MYKTFFLVIILTAAKLTAIACDKCVETQPRVFRGISHGTGPETKWDIWIVSLVAALVVVTLFYSVKWLIAPGEKSKEHIKNLVLTTAQ